jgi:hypothetical protein
MQREHTFRLGDCVIFREERRGTHPDRGAREVRPERCGEGYLFVVNEFWRVSELHAGHLLLRARADKCRVADANDPHLHVAAWWQRVFYRHHFLKLEPSSSVGVLANWKARWFTRQH